jgi:hypothetical protein
MLKNGWGVGKTEKHYLVFEMPIPCSECGFPLITRLQQTSRLLSTSDIPRADFKFCSSRKGIGLPMLCTRAKYDLKIIVGKK